MNEKIVSLIRQGKEYTFGFDVVQGKDLRTQFIRADQRDIILNKWYGVSWQFGQEGAYVSPPYDTEEEAKKETDKFAEDVMAQLTATVH
jgi:hypothetical protein